MTRRARDFGAYGNLQNFSHQTFELLVQEVRKSGVHSTAETPLPFDVLYEARVESDDRTPLLVSFHAAIGADTTYPYFSGRTVADSAGMDLLAFSEPALAVSTRFGSNFFLGTSEFDPTEYISTVIRAVTGDRALVFLGGSAGGFPALKFGNMFPESVTLAMNPVTDLMLNDTFLRTGAKITFPRWEYERIAAQRETTVRGARNLVIYAQNVQDRKFIRTHAARYFASLLQSGDEILLLTRDWGRGHIPMPSAEVVEVLEQVKQRPTLAELASTLRGRAVKGENASAVLADARLSAYRQRQRLKNRD